MSFTAVSPPVNSLWWDAEATLDAVLHQLRLETGDIDEDRVVALIPAAALLINNYLDRDDWIPGPPVDLLLETALEQVVIELYRRKDSPPTSSDQWAAMAGSVRFGAVDPLSEVLSMLAPYKQRFGIA